LIDENMVNATIDGSPQHLHVYHCRELKPHELENTIIDTVIKSHPYLNILLKIEAKIKSILSTEITK